MSKTKIFTIVGARPQFIKIDPTLSQKIIHTGQHYDYEMSQVFFKELKLPKPYKNLNCKSHEAGKMYDKLVALFTKEKPDLVIVIGDTISTLMGALAAAFCGIKIAHIEAGFRNGDMTMPEEISRVLVDRLSTVRFCMSLEAMRNLHKEGLIDHSFYFHGDPMFDAMNKFLPIKRTKDYGKYILVTLHRHFNTRERLKEIIRVLHATNENYYFPIHPRTLKMLKGIRIPKNIKLMQPVSYSKMLSLESNAKKIITDSGGVQREAYWMRIPCIIARKDTELNYILNDGWGKLAYTPQEIQQAVLTFSPTYINNQSELPVFGIYKKIKEKISKYV